MNKKALIIISIPILLIIGISAILGIYVFKETEDLSKYLEGTKQTALLEQVSAQKEINKKLDEMVSTGVLQNVLSVYFNDLEESYNNQIF